MYLPWQKRYIYDGSLIIHTANGKEYVYTGRVFFIGDYIENADTANMLIWKNDCPTAAMVGSDKSRIIVYRHAYDTNFTSVYTGNSSFWKVKPIGDYIAGIYRNTIQLFDMQTKQKTADLELPDSLLSYDRYKDTFAVMEQKSGIMHLYNLSDGTESQSVDFGLLTGENDTYWYTAVPENQSRIVAFSSSGIICLADENGARLLTNTEATLDYKQFTISPDGKHLIIEARFYTYETGLTTKLIAVNTGLLTIPTAA